MKVKGHRTRNQKFSRIDFHKRTLNLARVHRTLEVDKQNATPDTRVLRFDYDGNRIPESTR